MNVTYFPVPEMIIKFCYVFRNKQLTLGADAVGFGRHTCVSDIVYCDGALIWKISRYCWMILVAHGGVLC